MKKEVTASAPGKLMLFGEHSVVYGYPSIVTAVDQRLRVQISDTKELNFSVHAPDVGVDNYVKSIDSLGEAKIPKGVAFLEMLYKRFLEQTSSKKGIQVETSSDFSSEFGFGSSSAVTVAFAKALTEFHGLEATNEDLFHLCYQAVLDVQGVGSGFDLAAAIWGGTIYYVKPAKVVELLSANELPLIVGYTGIKANTVPLVKMVESEKERHPDKIGALFEQITTIVEFAKTAILAADWQKVGALMTENQALLQELGVSSTELDTLIHAANSSGAYGSKLSGAGGGDCMVTVAGSRERNSVEKHIEQVHGQVLRVQTSAQGARIE